MLRLWEFKQGNSTEEAYLLVLYFVYSIFSKWAEATTFRSSGIPRSNFNRSPSIHEGQGGLQSVPFLQTLKFPQHLQYEDAGATQRSPLARRLWSSAFPTGRITDLCFSFVVFMFPSSVSRSLFLIHFCLSFSFYVSLATFLGDPLQLAYLTVSLRQEATVSSLCNLPVTSSCARGASRLLFCVILSPGIIVVTAVQAAAAVAQMKSIFRSPGEPLAIKSMGPKMPPNRYFLLFSLSLLYTLRTAPSWDVTQQAHNSHMANFFS